MIARDFAHIAALYERYLRQPEVAEAVGSTKLVTEELDEQDVPIPAVPFSKWLFS